MAGDVAAREAAEEKPIGSRAGNEAIQMMGNPCPGEPESATLEDSVNCWRIDNFYSL